MTNCKEALQTGLFWSWLLPRFFMSKGKVALFEYLAKKELEYWGKPATDEAIRDWHNIGIVARIAYDVTRI